ncbi:hypothetical protein HUJ05_005221 [Dendroctonus ponderosae]|nr:hypothetical protein HUJ05_005221 [Dendroctonus ponderosae]
MSIGKWSEYSTWSTSGLDSLPAFLYRNMSRTSSLPLWATWVGSRGAAISNIAFLASFDSMMPLGVLWLHLQLVFLPLKSPPCIVGLSSGKSFPRLISRLTRLISNFSIWMATMDSSRRIDVLGSCTRTTAMGCQRSSPSEELGSRSLSSFRGVEGDPALAGPLTIPSLSLEDIQEIFSISSCCSAAVLAAKSFLSWFLFGNLTLSYKVGLNITSVFFSLTKRANWFLFGNLTLSYKVGLNITNVPFSLAKRANRFLFGNLTLSYKVGLNITNVSLSLTKRAKHLFTFFYQLTLSGRKYNRKNRRSVDRVYSVLLILYNYASSPVAANFVTKFIELLTGCAATWWQGVKSSIFTFDEAVTALIQAYGYIKPPHQIYRELFAMEQGTHKTDTFIGKARALLSHLKGDSAISKHV